MKYQRWHDRRHPPRTEVVARLALSILGITTCILSLTARATFTHAMLQIGGIWSQVTMVLMGCLGVVLLTDTIVNDVMPEGYEFQLTRHHRQQLWMSLGLIYVLFSALVFLANLSISLGTYLGIYALGSFAVAFIDAAGEKADRHRCEAT